MRNQEFTSWGKAKEIRCKCYQSCAETHDHNALRWTGGAWRYDTVPQALEGKAHCLTEEPCGAIGFHVNNRVRYRETVGGKWGCAWDLCPHTRGFRGSIILNEYIFGGEWPEPNFIFQNHICCSHTMTCELNLAVPLPLGDPGIKKASANTERGKGSDSFRNRYRW